MTVSKLTSLCSALNAGSINSLSSYVLRVQDYGSVIEPALDERDSHVCEKDLAIAQRGSYQVPGNMDVVKQGPTVLPFATAI